MGLWTERAAALLAIALAVPSVPAMAREDGASEDSAFELSANVGLVSDYRFRGISLSGRDPAIQGGFDLSHDSGLFVGTWASSIADYSGSNVELDIYGGYAGSFEGVDYSITALGYFYPGGSGVDYFEVLGTASTSFGPATVGLDAAWVPSQDNYGGNNFYMAAKTEIPVGETPVSLFGHLGYENGDSYDNKWDWEAGISYVAGPLTASVSYVDTNYSGANESGRLARAGVVATLVASF
ncbi:TorF family putative porin [Novosphingobium mangrovi (ex Huang et al. 2023)]|uniref:TorF family putative porin n=1 Tax=Novosphingobium mangrovi (ex Huang et al. 2023) TaxID=2976432 RepID=A0ABT2I9M0_9SPHN|nr:TorF family putative porin [Novosphingobium mangrovi (ex Huang et al. 2023)]MCT2401525.1 TorF family putative porin [Novosphingobium mangrovi (ex Huang et al. 2023)]